MSPTQERNLVVGLCTLFALSALGFAAVNRLAWVALLGWAAALLQTFRLHVLRTDPDRRPRGQVADVLAMALLTILVASFVYAAAIYYRRAGAFPGGAQSGRGGFDFEALQFAVYGLLVWLGGWVVAWVQGVRRLRLNLRYTAGGDGGLLGR